MWRRLVFGTATLAICSTLALGMQSKTPLVLYPITSNLPPGLYVRISVPPTVGMIAAFRVPEAAKRYKASIGEDVRDDFLFMKPIVAGPGDHVCRRSPDGIYVNGTRMASETTYDRAGRPLPQWRACRELADDEFFTLSTYMKTSFDSRHYGPIDTSSVAGMYRFILKDRG